MVSFSLILYRSQCLCVLPWYMYCHLKSTNCTGKEQRPVTLSRTDLQTHLSFVPQGKTYKKEHISCTHHQICRIENLLENNFLECAFRKSRWCD